MFFVYFRFEEDASRNIYRSVYSSLSNRLQYFDQVTEDIPRIYSDIKVPCEEYTTKKADTDKKIDTEELMIKLKLAGII